MASLMQIRKKIKVLERKAKKKRELQQAKARLRSLKFGKYKGTAKKIGRGISKVAVAYHRGFMTMAEKEERRLYGKRKKRRRPLNIWQ